MWRSPATRGLPWKRGRDTDDVSVMHGPLYVHEKVNAVEFLNSMLKDSESLQSDMFSTFNGTPEGAAFEPYQHSGNWTNRLVRAPSQRMMASLLEREGMRGKVGMIYMDPPYNIDFRSNWQGLIDDLNVTETPESVPYDLEQVKAFKDSYKEGVHSYLGSATTSDRLGQGPSYRTPVVCSCRSGQVTCTLLVCSCRRCLGMKITWLRFLMSWP